MKTITNILFLLLVSFYPTLQAQVGGNQVYGNTNTHYPTNPSGIQKGSMVSTQSALTIHARVLLHKVADYYLLYVGVSQEGNTVIECNQKIDKRINNLIKSLKQMGVARNEIYVDFISQTKIYDYKFEENKANQFLKGFETKKNVIITLKEIEQIDEVINLCSVEKIYDIIKVEYADHDIEKIYDALFEEAISVIESRKKRFTDHSSIKLSPTYRITGDKLSIHYPKTQYRKYDEAFESSDFSIACRNRSGNFIKKEKRKDNTFYYEGVEATLVFDRIINKAIPKIGIQYIVDLSLIYEFEK
ncbi:SIMPL domain-containing protein [bacterium]|nr:SIMPL domain-containing protein [bacterium]